MSMQNKELLSYIKEALAKGYSKIKDKKRLLIWLTVLIFVIGSFYILFFVKPNIETKVFERLKIFSPEPAQIISPAERIAVLYKGSIIPITTTITSKIESPVLVVDPFSGVYYWRYEPEALSNYNSFGGSGFIISSDGFILTNAHVVSIEKQEMEKALYRLANDYNMGIIESAFPGEWGWELYEEWWLYIEEEVKRSAKILESEVDLKVNVPIFSTESLSKTREYKAEIRKLGAIIGVEGSGKDVALLKINAKNLPTVKLAKSADVKVGERVYILGYPEVATFHPYLSEESISEPTLTQGIISAIKTTPDGLTVFQTDAAIHYGNSGGPAFNEKGEVIGIATFGSPELFGFVQGFNFLVSIDTIQDFIREFRGVDKRSIADEHYEKGIDFFSEQKYKEAIEEFEKVIRLAPLHPTVRDFLSLVQEKLER